MDQAFSIIVNSITQAAAWLTSIFNSAGFWSYFLYAFIIYSVYRFLLVPIFGGQVGSDQVKKKKKGGDDA